MLDTLLHIVPNRLDVLFHDVRVEQDIRVKSYHNVPYTFYQLFHDVRVEQDIRVKSYHNVPYTFHQLFVCILPYDPDKAFGDTHTFPYRIGLETFVQSVSEFLQTEKDSQLPVIHGNFQSPSLGCTRSEVGILHRSVPYRWHGSYRMILQNGTQMQDHICQYWCLLLSVGSLVLSYDDQHRTSPY